MDTGQTAGVYHLETTHLTGACSCEACSAFTRVAARTLARSPVCDQLAEGFSHFVISMTAPVASGWSVRRVGLAPTGKRRLVTAHTSSGHSGCCPSGPGTCDSILRRLGELVREGTYATAKLLAEPIKVVEARPVVFLATTARRRVPDPTGCQRPTDTCNLEIQERQLLKRVQCIELDAFRPTKAKNSRTRSIRHSAHQTTASAVFSSAAQSMSRPNPGVSGAVMKPSMMGSSFSFLRRLMCSVENTSCS